jgi:hypothetical protein
VLHAGLIDAGRMATCSSWSETKVVVDRDLPLHYNVVHDSTSETGQIRGL